MSQKCALTWSSGADEQRRAFLVLAFDFMENGAVQRCKYVHYKLTIENTGVLW